MEWVGELVVNGVIAFINRVSDEIVKIFSGQVVDTMAGAIKILDTAYIINAILISQAIAGTLLVLYIAIEALKSFILYNNGEEIDAGGLLKRSVISAAVIGSSPWIVKYIYQFGTTFALDVARLVSTNANTFNPDQYSTVGMGNLIVLPIVFIIAIFIWGLIFIQMQIRSVELAVLAVTGPILAAGFISADGGTGKLWWKELIAISMTQPLQIFLIKGALISGSLLTGADGFTQLIALIAWLWVAYKAPSVVKQYTHTTGIGGAVGGAAQQVGTMVLMRKMMTRGV